MTKENLKRKTPLLIVAVLAVCLVVAAALLIGPALSKQAAAERQGILKAVMPGGSEFVQIDTKSKSVKELYAAYRDETLMGYCVEVQVEGFVSPITMMVGVAHGGNVIGTHILSHRETLNVADKAMSPEFLNQFLGRSGTLNVGHGARDIQAVSGATVSCKSLTEGVNAALAAAANITKEGGASVHEPAG
ncbi:MAG: FMN-binding protein [Oscillospiraceae bacterium]